MIDGPIGQKWVCAAGVERSTLHRCGLTGLGDGIPFFHSSRGPWSVTFPGRDREVEVIKKRCFSSHLRSRGKVACQAGLYIPNYSCLLTGCSSLSTPLTVRPLYEWKNMRKGSRKKERKRRRKPTTVQSKSAAELAGTRLLKKKVGERFREDASGGEIRERRCVAFILLLPAKSRQLDVKRVKGWKAPT